MNESSTLNIKKTQSSVRLQQPVTEHVQVNVNNTCCHVPAPKWNTKSATILLPNLNDTRTSICFRDAPRGDCTAGFSSWYSTGAPRHSYSTAPQAVEDVQE